MSERQLALRAAYEQRIHHISPRKTAPSAEAGSPDDNGTPVPHPSLPHTVAIAVLCRFAPAMFAQSVLDLARQLSKEQGEQWLRAYTRTLFLIGDPAKLRKRFSFAHVTSDQSLAWVEPAAAAGPAMGLRRLLALFGGEVRLDPPADFSISTCEESARTAPPALYDLQIATAGVTIGKYLVNLSHTLAESMLTGVLVPNASVRIRHVPAVYGGGRHDYLRVVPDASHPERLRACVSLVRSR